MNIANLLWSGRRHRAGAAAYYFSASSNGAESAGADDQRLSQSAYAHDHEIIA
jgi:hypothetical protein